MCVLYILCHYYLVYTAYCIYVYITNCLYLIGENYILMKKKNKIIACEECGKRTSNFYPVFINKGKAYKCVECFENGIRRGSKIYQLGSSKNNYEKK